MGVIEQPTLPAWSEPTEPSELNSKVGANVVAMGTGFNTEVTTVELLLAAPGSELPPLTPAVLDMLPAVVGVTTILIVAVAFMARLPSEHTTVAELTRLQTPWLEEADTKVTPTGRLSVTVTPVAVLGPVLPIVNE